MNFANGKENCLMHALQNEVANKNWSELQVEFKYVTETVTTYYLKNHFRTGPNHP